MHHPKKERNLFTWKHFNPSSSFETLLVCLSQLLTLNLLNRAEKTKVIYLGGSIYSHSIDNRKETDWKTEKKKKETLRPVAKHKIIYRTIYTYCTK